MDTPIEPRELVRSRRAALSAHTVRGELFELAGGAMRCTACAHRCVLGDGLAGACGVRVRRGDELRVPFGYVARRYVRPIETNTVLHVRPGTRALSFGMYGCDLRCAYCHNWRLSQALRDPEAGGPLTVVAAADLVDEAVSEECSAVCSAYNEPLVTAEWAYAVFAHAKRRDLVTAVVTDGHTTPEAMAYLRPVTDVFRVDLKTYDDDGYRSLGGRLAPVVDAIAEAKRLGYWVEVVSLIVPGFNDDPRGLRRLAEIIRAVDPAIPWHLNAFQPRYRMTERPSPARAELVSLAGMAYARGLSFVYVGNAGDGPLTATRCPACQTVLVERSDWRATKIALVNGSCPRCGTSIPGLW